MLTTYEKQYEGDSIRRQATGVIRLLLPRTGTITRLRLLSAGGAFFGVWYFNVRLNGVGIFSGTGGPPTGYLRMFAGNLSDERAGLEIEGTEGQELSVDLVQKGQGGLTAPLTIIFDINDETLTTQTVPFTTASIANGATATGTVAIAKDFKLKRVEVSHAARVRLYKTAADRTADAARVFGDRSYRGTSHGMLCDLYLDGVTYDLNWPMAPSGNCENGDTPETSTIYYSVTNISGGTHAIDVELDVLPEQE